MSDVTIKYKGQSIATMDASGTKTLGTHGKYCEGDIAVEYTKPAAPSGTKQISITENGTVTEDVTNYASAEITVDVQGGSKIAAPKIEQFVVYKQEDGAWVDITGNDLFVNSEIEKWLDDGMPIRNVKFTNVAGNTYSLPDYSTSPVYSVVYGANSPSLILGNNKVYSYAGVKIGLSTRNTLNSLGDCLPHDLAPVELKAEAITGNYYFDYKGRRINQYKQKVTNPTGNDVVINSVYFVSTAGGLALGAQIIGIPNPPNGTERVE